MISFSSLLHLQTNQPSFSYTPPKPQTSTMPTKLHIILLLSLFHFSLYTTPTTSLTHPADVAALRSIKSYLTPTSIPPSSCISSWDFSHDPCKQPKTTSFICGITCSSDSNSNSVRIVTITLDSVGYSGPLSPLISQLTHLIILDLGQNSFIGSIPNSISSLTLLQTLSLRLNSFSGPLPSSLSTLTNLQDLDLSGNSLSGPIPTLSTLSHLTRLDLSFNKFSGKLPKLPPNLLSLAAKSNHLTGEITKLSFSGLTQLETVELSCNSFSGVLRSWFFQLPSLQQVNLSNNSLTGVEIWRPKGGSDSALVAVDLGFNKIEGNVPVNFVGYANLALISLRYNRLRGPIPLEYSKKGTLRRLYLDGNYLSGTPPAGFFAGGIAGSFGDNCLRGCPRYSQLCLPSQKPMSVCKQVYGGKRHP